LQLLDSFPVWNGIVRETGTIGKNLFNNFVRECIEVALCVLGEKDRMVTLCALFLRVAL
jgi:hypothetical protein